MGKSQSNPTGYETRAEPDFGPLFSATANEPPRSQEAKKTAIPLAPSLLGGESSPLPRAVDIAAKVASERYKRILRSIANNGPSTLFELCARFAVTPNQISGRITELKRKGLLAPIGQKPHPVSGAACDVLHLTDQGRSALKEGKPL